MADQEATLVEEYEALLQFLYLAPVGLVQASIDGDIVMINPASARMLMPLSRDGNLTNLFDALGSQAPDLRQMIASFEPRHGMVCDALQIEWNACAPGRADSRMLALSLLKLDEHRLMAVLGELTDPLRQPAL